jgi:hypothetical protein
LKHATWHTALNKTPGEPKAKSAKREDGEVIRTRQQMPGIGVSQAVAGVRVQN